MSAHPEMSPAAVKRPLPPLLQTSAVGSSTDVAGLGSQETDAKSDDAADHLEPNDSSRLPSTAAEDEWVIVGNCWGPTPLRRSELTEFQRGNRDFIAWAVGISALIFLVAMLLG